MTASYAGVSPATPARLGEDDQVLAQGSVRVRQTVSGALRAGRIAAERHMEQAEVAGFPWKEETVTDLLLAEVATRIKVVPFTRPQEAQLGADWLWWWIDGTGEAFGMLVQAKRLRTTSRRWRFDFEYPRGSGTQRSRLLGTGRWLGVPATYGLYLGTRDYRAPGPCGAEHKRVDCNQCRRTTVSLMPSLLADSSFVVDAASTYSRSVALEDLGRRQPSAGTAIQHVHPALRRRLDPGLQAFLSKPQSGARRVARELLDTILVARLGQFEAAITEQETYETLGPIFASMPLDQGHFGEPYFPHVLSGLRPTPPSYVLDAEHADGAIEVPAELSNLDESDVAGVVVARLG